MRECKSGDLLGHAALEELEKSHNYRLKKPLLFIQKWPKSEFSPVRKAAQKDLNMALSEYEKEEKGVKERCTKEEEHETHG